MRAVIKGVNRSAKGPQIVLSRAHPALLIRLFEQEVPEIADGIVKMRGAAREAGDRAKVAVTSRERDVDPVGACVGSGHAGPGHHPGAARREDRHRRVVGRSGRVRRQRAQPGQGQRVSIVDEGESVMEVIVQDKQLSLAIGKKGQNV